MERMDEFGNRDCWPQRGGRLQQWVRQWVSGDLVGVTGSIGELSATEWQLVRDNVHGG